jgi:hypothetical protein
LMREYPVTEDVVEGNAVRGEVPAER